MMKKWKKITLISLGSLLAILFLFLLIFRWYLSTSVAQYEGVAHIPNLTASVQVGFDEKGIPFIQANTKMDAIKTMGFLHASERLFQLELTKRYVTGKLSEVFGAAALGVDRHNLLLGFHRKALLDELRPEDEEILQAYCDGVNAWVDQQRVLPPEFVILGFKPEPLTPKLIQTIANYFQWFNYSLMDKDSQFQTLVDSIGKNIIPYLKEYKQWSPPTIHDGYLTQYFNTESYPFRMTQASNSWTISPQKSVSGNALHAADPHLAVNSIPGFWYALSIKTNDGFVATGISVVGFPAIVMGHNGTAAFSFTVAPTDIIDYYEFKKNKNDSTEYFSINGYHKFEIFTEKILIKDEREKKVDLKWTELGPVVKETDSTVIAIKWAGNDVDGSILGNILTLSQVKTFSEFQKKVRGLGALNTNWMYSDTYGNIGYQLSSPLPIREFTNTFEVLDGADPLYRWNGYQPDDQIPYAFNPKNGYLISANNQIISPKTGKEIPGYYDPYRIVRIEQLLQSKLLFDAEDMRNFQLDTKSIKAERWNHYLVTGLEASGKKIPSEIMNDWNYSFHLTDTKPTFFSLWYYYLVHEIFSDELGDKWMSGNELMESILDHPDSLAFIVDDQRTPTVETLTEISIRAIEKVKTNFNKLPNWEELNLWQGTHPLSTVKILDWYLNLNRGPIPLSGDNSSVNVSFHLYSEKEKKFFSQMGPSMRFVLDWANIDGFSLHTNLGQSGNPFSPHYDDFLDIWKNNEGWNVPFSSEVVEKRIRKRLEIK